MTPTPDQTPERPKTESLALIICDREGYPVGGHEERQPQGEYVRADECLKMEQEYERKLTALRATNATLAERVRRLEEALNAADSVMWMAERYAEGGGSNGPEMQDYLSATRIVLKVRGSYHNPSPTPGAAVGKEGE